MKIAYKAFDKNLCCRGEQFKIGETYTKEAISADNLRTCTGAGWHYCDELEETFKFYSFNGENRFCKIEVLGAWKKDSYDKKCITTSFKIIEEVNQFDIKKRQLQVSVDGLPLQLMEKLQNLYPLHFGGSTALLLYGCNLFRKIKDKGIDLDVVLPYYIKIRKEDMIKAGIPVDKVEYHGAKASGNDFDDTVAITFKTTTGTDLFDEIDNLGSYLKLDIRIDPKQSYNIVKYKDMEFRLSLPETILEAKIKYALNGQKKHADDIYDLLNINLNVIE